jgi:hypothetical protein
MEVDAWLREHGQSNEVEPLIPDTECGECGGPIEEDRTGCKFCAACAKAMWTPESKRKEGEPVKVYGWPPEAKQWLTDNYQKLRAKECARHLGKNIDSIYKEAHVLGLSNKHTTPRKEPCQFCGRECDPRGVKAHERGCKENPANKESSAEPVETPDEPEESPAEVFERIAETETCPDSIEEMEVDRAIVDAMARTHPEALLSEEDTEPEGSYAGADIGEEDPFDNVDAIAPEASKGETRVIIGGVDLTGQVYVVPVDEVKGGEYFEPMVGGYVSVPGIKYDTFWCVYCQRFERQESGCLMRVRGDITGILRPDVRHVKARKDDGECRPFPTLVGQLRRLVGLPVSAR